MELIFSKSTCSQEVQTEQENPENSKKAIVYEKIDDQTRCELIRRLQQEKISLKEAAKELSINYSTAKTIVQTFRREKRIAKKPKRQVETKQAKKRERALCRKLSANKVNTIVEMILENEAGIGLTTKKCNEPKEEIKDASTLPTNQPKEPENPLKHQNNFGSAPDFTIFQEKEDGPKEDQISRGVGTHNDLILLQPKKPIFYTYSNKNMEDEYKEKIDYSNLVIFRSKETGFNEEIELLPSSNVFPEIGEKKPRSMTSITEDEKPFFNFKFLAEDIYFSAFERRMNCTSINYSERTLPEPRIGLNQQQV